MTRKLNWTTTLFLTLTPILGVALALWHSNPERSFWLPLSLFLMFYTFTGISITAGFHRYYAHKTYETIWPVRLFFTLFGAAAFQTSTLCWSTSHRMHHRFEDTDKDPYGINKGFWYAHFGWMCEDSPDYTIYAEKYSRDLLRDKMVIWQDKYYVPVSLFMCFMLPGLISLVFWGDFLDGLIYGGFLRLAAVHHSTFFINSLCHFWGSKPFNSEITARDNPVVAFFTFGEGFHNFHHCFANDYRNAIRWYQYDPSKWLIQTLAFLGIAWNLKQVSREQILERQMVNDMSKVSTWDKIDASIRERFEETVQQFQLKMRNLESLRKEYQSKKQKFVEDSSNHLEKLRTEIQLAQIEIENMSQQWKLMLRSLSRQALFSSTDLS